MAAWDVLTVSRETAANSANYGPLYLDDVGRKMTDVYGQKLGQDVYVSHGGSVDLVATGNVLLSWAQGTIKDMIDAEIVSVVLTPAAP